MISRRNIRVKVMQSLYTLDALEADLKPGEPAKILQKHLDQTRELFVYLVYMVTEIARYAETDSRLRSSKHLPSQEDLNVNIKLAGNELLWKIMEDPAWAIAMGSVKPQHVEGSTELVRKLYLELVESDIYKLYIHQDGREKKTEKQIIEYIFTQLMLGSDDFVGHIEEHFSNWDDDAEMVHQLTLQYILKPGNGAFQEMVSKEKREFAFGLLRTVLEKKETNMELIRPKLKNWDAERIAVLDLILLQMGISEFLYFETIPPKVTINEYIDLAKEYSTPQSGQFVNGLLDNIHKDLSAAGKLHKVNFR